MKEVAERQRKREKARGRPRDKESKRERDIGRKVKELGKETERGEFDR